MALVRRTAAFAITATVLLAPLSGAAQAPACRRLRARAGSEAALLLAPRVSLGVVRVPRRGGETGEGLFQGPDVQLRSSLAWSPLDALRAAWVLSAAGRECDRLDARTRLVASLEAAERDGELSALRAQLAYLERARVREGALVARAEARRDEGIATAEECRTLELRRLALERTRHRVRTRIRELEADLADAADRPTSEPPALDEDLRRYEAATMAAEAQHSRVRRLSPWRLDVNGGVIPGSPIDWFGAASVSMSFGVIAHRRSEEAYLAARAAELEGSPTELRHRVERLEAQLARRVEGTEGELELLEAQLSLVDAQLQHLADLEGLTGQAQQAKALAELNRIDLEGQRRYRSRLLEAWRPLVRRTR
ncbi:MAG: hypothetical protein ACFCGT_01775 [Sandaracinaceae bacterium]